VQLGSLLLSRFPQSRQYFLPIEFNHPSLIRLTGVDVDFGGAACKRLL
jgi:hypothetical protein